MAKKNNGNEYGWGSILAGIAGFFFFIFIPLFCIIALIFGFIAIVKRSVWKGFIGIIIGIIGLVTFYAFGGILALI